MRSRVALLVALAVLGGLVVFAAGPNAEQTVALPTPTPAPIRSVTSTSSPTVAATPSPSASAPVGDVTVDARRVSVPSDFRYLESWAGRVLLLDLTKRTATLVATYKAASLEPGYPGAQLSSSADGRNVLLLVVRSPFDGSLFLLTPETGTSRVVARGAIQRALISPDGARFAIARHEEGPGFEGLWVGTIADGSIHRLIADDPHLVGSPPVPLAFSPDGQVLAFGLGMGDLGYRAGLIPFGAGEVDAGQLRDPNATTAGVTLLDVGSAGEFRSANELFVWSSRGAFGGQTVAYLYNIASKTKVDLYRPTGDVRLEAAWRPGTDQFATLESPSCCGVGIGRTPWLRGRDGSAKQLTEASPFLGETWWSKDGSKLYSTTGGDDSNGGVRDLMTGQPVMGFCKRGGEPGRCV